MHFHIVNIFVIFLKTSKEIYVDSFTWLNAWKNVKYHLII